MDPVSMILSFALNNPQVTENAISKYSTPGQIDASKLQISAADFAMQTLSCYHKSARFRGVDILGAPWREQNKFGATGSVVMRISFNGLSGAQYEMIVAAMARDHSYRTFVITESSLVPYNKKCTLESWISSAKSE
jgi:hypothetical protein